ncbi:autotransporter domain-containing protein [Bradyrhizobium sp. S69]|uniref:autotransporter outer membrane beta-barrel domain-containing protein n=1 Tax=Bradyrhizobium sp. S69 TaxID=1641856 RepID=UPI0024BF6382|nr:autotransporter domain-containing protein [Bradyrhizobium sp. S69]
MVLVPLTAIAADGDGGKGGNAALGSSGGTGGSGFTGNPGNPGVDSGSGTGGGGGGGSAGGGNGGVGGHTGGAGGPGGSAGGGNGVDGTDGAGLGQGGGGGGGGGNGASTANLNNSATLQGGSGGKGGDGGHDLGNNGSAGGAGGGAGGYGAVVTGSGASLNNVGALLQGGIGGAGGQAGGTQSGIGSAGGGGGNGGVGIQFAAPGAIFTNLGAVQGGNGGAAGVGTDGNGGPGTNGAQGLGGTGVVGAGLTIVNSGTISGGLAADNATRADAIDFTGGANTLTLSGGWTMIGGIALDTASTSVNFSQSAPQTVANLITGSGSVAQSGTGTLVLSGANTYSGGTTIRTGATLQLGVDTVLVHPGQFNSGIVSSAIGTGTLTFDGGKLQAFGGSSEREIANAVQITANGGTIDAQGGFFRITSNITDAAGSSGGTLVLESTTGGIEREIILAGNNTYSGVTSVASGFVIANSSTALSPNSAFQVGSAGTVTLSGFSNTIASLADGVGGGGVVQNAAANGTAALTITGAQGGTTTFSGVLRDGTGGEGGNGGPVLALVKDGTSTQVLSGTNHYTGTTTVNGGALQVDGSIVSSSMTTVNANGVLTGAGAVGNVTIAAGGTLLPGNGIAGSFLSVTGNLAFQSGALYLVQVTPAISTSTKVTGTAALNGLVGATFASGTYVAKQYNILSAAGGVSGTFSGIQTLGLPKGFATSLSYDAKDAYLNLTLNFTSGPNFGGGLNANQQNVANALTNFFNATGGIPMVFGGLTPAGLTQVSGETATGSQQTTFDAMNLFMSLMTDPFVAGRGDGTNNGNGATGYADEANAYAGKRKPNDALAAIYTKAPAPVQSFEQRWSTWIAGYGGSQTTSGNAVLGSNNTTSSVYGTAVGADYRFSPETIAGFSLAGGGTNFNVVGSGYGRSDLFQAGAFIRHNEGPAYITAALAYGWQDITTDRIVTAAGADHLRAEFNANAISGRLDGGYRFVTPFAGGIGITPYAAAQFTTFDLPAYAENALAGSPLFALSYASKSVTDTRSELGIRTDKSFAMTNAILTLRGRAAWAHDYDPDRSVAATFQALPGASFVVNGAAQAADSALVTASADVKWLNGWSTAATFEGEFSNVTSSYAGKGVVRYAW